MRTGAVSGVAVLTSPGSCVYTQGLLHAYQHQGSEECYETHTISHCELRGIQCTVLSGDITSKIYIYRVDSVYV